MQIVALDRRIHDRSRFDCGVFPLNNYLRLQANQSANKDQSRTNVLVDPDNATWIAGYYTLAMASFTASSLPETLQNRHSEYRTAALLARLAVDKRYTGRGYGTFMLADALKRLEQASDLVGFPFVVADSKDGLAGFYEQFGFKPFIDIPDRLFITIKAIRASLA